MSRPLRIEYPGLVSHIYVRGNAKQDIFHDDHDREVFLDLLGQTVEQFRWILTAYALMSNHFHLVVQLTRETLSRGMQWLNGQYPRAFNRRHKRVGHLYQGRFKSPPIEDESYGLEALRYVVLNPVRAGIVCRPEDYRWSSHAAVLGLAKAPAWLAVDDILIQFAPERDLALRLYRQFVDEAIAFDEGRWAVIAEHIYLGSDEFRAELRKKIDLKPRADEIPRSQRFLKESSMAAVIRAVAGALSLSENSIRYGRGGAARMLAAWVAWHEGLLSGRQIAAGLRMRGSGHVSRLIRECDEDLKKDVRLREAVDASVSTMRGEKQNGRPDPK